MYRFLRVSAAAEVPLKKGRDMPPLTPDAFRASSVSVSIGWVGWFKKNFEGILKPIHF
jgi:hypothetical protein